MTTVAKSQATSRDLPWLIGLGALVVIGIAAWVVQLTQGFEVVGVGQAIVWGIYIATFFVLAGIASGLVVFTALSDLRVIPGLQAYRRKLLVGALACYVASGFTILMDIGQPGRVLNMIFSANLSSPFVWDFAGLALSVIVTAVYLYAVPKGRLLPALAGIVASLVLLAEGFILSMSAAHLLWHGGLIPVVFLVEGLLAAAAVLLIGVREPQASRWLRRLALTLLPALVVLNLLEIAAVMYAGNPEAQAATNLFLSGILAPLFWGQALFGILAPFLLLFLAGENRSAVIAAAVLAILGVLVTKLGMLVSGQALPFMRPLETYTPTLVEAGVVVGVIGLAGLLFALGRGMGAQKTAQ
jgi:molybdopterin-containing oxidoreductase family membrane subunit